MAMDTEHNETNQPTEPQNNADETKHALEQSKDGMEEAKTSASLDKLDASPTAVRRGRMVVGVMLVLAIVAVIVLIVMPPLSWKPPKSIKQNFESVSTAEAVEPGADERMALFYAPIENSLHYRVRLQQDVTYASGNPMHSTLAGRLEMFQPRRKDLSESVGMKLLNAQMTIEDGERPVELGESGEMLGGVSLYVRLDAHDGLGMAIPDSNINPQVARVMYILADALRNVWLPLPKEDVGLNAAWKLSEVTDRGGNYSRRASTQLNSIHPDVQTKTTFELIHRDGNTERVAGNGEVTVLLKDNRVQSAKLVMTRGVDASGSGVKSQRIEFELAYEPEVQPEAMVVEPQH